MGLGADAVRRVQVIFTAEDRGVGAATKGMTGAVAALAAAAAVATAAIKFMGDETERLDNIAKGINKSGLGVGAYQELSHVATLSGTSVANLSKATIKLEKNLLEIAGGGGKIANDALVELNLTTAELAGKTDTERLGILGDALLEVESKTKRAALAQSVLGRSGSDLLPLLIQGADGIDKMSESVGKIFTAEDLAKAEAYQDSLANMRKAASDLTGEIVVGLAPAFTEISDTLTEAGSETSDLVPAIVELGERSIEAIEPIIDLLVLVADGLALTGRMADLADSRIDILGRDVSDLGDRVGDFISESRLNVWADDAGESVDDLSESGSGLSEWIDENIPASKELAQTWDEVKRAMTGASIAASELSAVGDIKARIASVVNLGKAHKQQEQDAQDLRDERADAIEDQADAADRAADVLAASGAKQSLVNEQIFIALQLRRQAAEAAGDEKREIEAQHDLNVEFAKLSAKKGGRGPTVAQRVAVAGEEEVANLEHVAELMATIAETAEQTADAEDAARVAALARIDLEIDVLEVTKARGRVAQQERDNAITALEREAGVVRLEARVEALAREAAEMAEIFDIAVELEAIEISEAARVIDMETFRLSAQAKRLDNAGQFAAAAQTRLSLLARETEAERLLFEQRELDILNNPPETELERIQQREELQQLSHERELARMEQESSAAGMRNAELARLDEAERKRVREGWKLKQQIAQAGASVARSGMELSKIIIGAAVKDADKRAKIEMKLQGVMAIAKGAVEVVNAAAAGASLNIPQAIAHGAAAAVAFATGGALMAGNLPPASGASIGASAPAPQRVERDTSEAATTVESVPAADRQPGQRLGDPRAGQGGNVVNIENLNALGAIDRDFAESMAIEIGKVSNGLENTG